MRREGHLSGKVKWVEGGVEVVLVVVVVVVR